MIVPAAARRPQQLEVVDVLKIGRETARKILIPGYGGASGTLRLVGRERSGGLPRAETACRDLI